MIIIKIYDVPAKTYFDQYHHLYIIKLKMSKYQIKELLTKLDLLNYKFYSEISIQMTIDAIRCFECIFVYLSKYQILDIQHEVGLYYMGKIPYIQLDSIHYISNLLLYQSLFS